MSVTRLRCVLAVVTFALAGCGPAVPPVGNYATVSGRVTDAATGAGLAGATLTVNIVLVATTDANGNFKIAPVPTGDWQYQVTPPPNYAAPGPVTPAPLGPGEQRTLDIALTHL
jgi:hypothetical protein